MAGRLGGNGDVRQVQGPRLDTSQPATPEEIEHLRRRLRRMTLARNRWRSYVKYLLDNPR